MEGPQKDSKIVCAHIRGNQKQWRVHICIFYFFVDMCNVWEASLRRFVCVDQHSQS